MKAYKQYIHVPVLAALFKCLNSSMKAITQHFYIVRFVFPLFVPFLVTIFGAFFYLSELFHLHILFQF